MSKESEAVKLWRTNTKARMIAAFGGECGICGYNRCAAALTFHHLDPSKKDFALGHMMARPRSWKRIVDELRKCVCLCCRCHTEVHAKIVCIPKDIRAFNEAFVDYKPKSEEFDVCSVCGEKKLIYKKSCSRRCAARLSQRVDWDHVDLKKLLKSNSFRAIGRILGISDVAVRKRAKKLGFVS